MKKFNVAAASLMAAVFLFSACDEAADSGLTVEPVSVSSVVPEEAQKMEVELDVETFLEKVFPAISSEFEPIVNIIFDVDEEESEGDEGGAVRNLAKKVLFDEVPSPVPVAGNEEDESTTVDEFLEFYDEIGDVFYKDFYRVLESGESADFKIDNFKLPEGPITYPEDAPLKGLDAVLHTFSVNADASGSVKKGETREQDEMSVKASASARAVASAEIKDLEFADCAVKTVPYGKANVAVSADLSGLSLNFGFEDVNAKKTAVLADEMVKAPEVKAREPEYEPFLKTMDGKLTVYAGLDGAFYFEVTDSDKMYNGVMKVTAIAQADYRISADVQDLIDGFAGTDEEYQNSIEKLPGSVRVIVSVYDVSGKKLFDLINENSWTGVFERFGSDTEESEVDPVVR